MPAAWRACKREGVGRGRVDSQRGCAGSPRSARACTRPASPAGPDGWRIAPGAHLAGGHAAGADRDGGLAAQSCLHGGGVVAAERAGESRSNEAGAGAGRQPHLPGPAGAQHVGIWGGPAAPPALTNHAESSLHQRGGSRRPSKVAGSRRPLRSPPPEPAASLPAAFWQGGQRGSTQPGVCCRA